MVFEKTEMWSFESPGASEMLASAHAFWAQRGYSVQSTSAASFQGRSFHSTLGIHRVVEILTTPSGPGTIVQLRYRADVRADVAAGGAVVAVLLLPVAVVGAALSWHEYEADWSRERWDFWNYLINTTKAKPIAAPPVPPPPAPLTATSSAPPPPPPPPAAVGPGPGAASPGCPACGAPVTGEGKFCSSCGTAIPRT